MGRNSSCFEVLVVSNCLKINACDPMKQKIRSRIVLLLLCWVVISLLLLPAMGWAQAAPAKPKKPLLDFGGQVGLYTDMFWTSDSSLSSRLMQRETVVQRFQASARLNVWKFKIPINLNLGTPMSRLGDFEIPRPNLKQVLLNQRNGAALHPTIGKLTGHIGSHTFKASRMTAGNIPFATGLGLDYKSKNLRIAASYGITQALVQRDSAQRIAGQYQREMAGFQFAVGNDKANQFMVNYVRARDMADRRLADSLISKRPRVDGGVVSVGWRLKISEHIYWQTEAGVSVNSSDASQAALELDSLDSTGQLTRDYGKYYDLARKFFLFNFPMELGYSTNTKVGIRKKVWDVELKGDYISAAFRSLAYRNPQNDRIDLSGQANLRLFKNRVALRAGGGQRENNVNMTPLEWKSKAATNHQNRYEAGATLQLFKILNLRSSYTGYALRSVWLSRVMNTNDSTAQRQTSSNFSFSPSLALGKKVTQSISGNFGRDIYQSYDFYVQDSLALDLQTYMWSYNHQINIPKVMGITLGFHQFQNQQFQQWNAQLGLQTSLMKGKLMLMGQMQVGDSEDNPFAAGRLRSFSLNTNFQPNKKWGGSLVLNIRQQEIAGKIVDIGLARIHLTYNFSITKS